GAGGSDTTDRSCGPDAPTVSFWTLRRHSSSLWFASLMRWNGSAIWMASGSMVSNTARYGLDRSNVPIRTGQVQRGPLHLRQPEPPRVARRLQTLRGWSHDRREEAGEVSGGAAGSGCSDGV